MLNSLVEFLRALWPWLAFALFDLLGQNFNIPILRDFTDSELMALLFVTVLLGSFLAFHRIKGERDECMKKLDRREIIEAVLGQLSSLREQGVTLRHEGASFEAADEIEGWRDRVSDWRAQVISQLYKLSPAEVGFFKTLDFFQAPDYSDVMDSDQRHQVRMLFAETHRIEAASLRWQGYLA